VRGAAEVAPASNRHRCQKGSAIAYFDICTDCSAARDTAVLSYPTGSNPNESPNSGGMAAESETKICGCRAHRHTEHEVSTATNLEIAGDPTQELLSVELSPMQDKHNRCAGQQQRPHPHRHFSAPDVTLGEDA
jgi:hypothetical protein